MTFNIRHSIKAQQMTHTNTHTHTCVTGKRSIMNLCVLKSDLTTQVGERRKLEEWTSGWILSPQTTVPPVTSEVDTGRGKTTVLLVSAQ